MNGELVFHKDAELTFYPEVVLDKCAGKVDALFFLMKKISVFPNNTHTQSLGFESRSH